MILGRISRISTAVAAAALLLGACQSGDDTGSPPTAVTPTAGTGSPSGTTTGTASGTSSGSTSPADGGVPAAARANTAAGAEAFARYYFQRINVAWTDPRQAIAADLSLGSCKSCSNLRRNIELLRAADEHLSAKPYRVSNFVELPESTSSHRAFQFALEQQLTFVLDESGKRKRSQPAERHLAEVLLERQANRWATADLALADVDAS